MTFTRRLDVLDVEYLRAASSNLRDRVQRLRPNKSDFRRQGDKEIGKNSSESVSKESGGGNN